MVVVVLSSCGMMLRALAAGPPTAQQVSAFWSNLQQKHPHASIVASSLDAFVAEVLSGNIGELQMVTEELGDSWLYGTRLHEPIATGQACVVDKLTAIMVARGTSRPN